MNGPAVSSEDIKKALAEKHCEEFFLLEVKSGASGCHWQQIDALAIYKSWVHQRIVAYEIKTSRSDFQRDAKMTTYLQYCHEMYLVCPQGMIQATELPIEIGLMYYNPQTQKIVTRRKALFRHINISPDFLYYIIMYRLRSDRFPFHSDSAAYFRDWLANKQSNRQLGCHVRGRIAEEIRRLNDEQDKSKMVREQAALVTDIVHVMSKHGLRIWGMNSITQELDRALSKCFLVNLDATVIQLDAALKTVKSLNDIWKLKEEGK